MSLGIIIAAFGAGISALLAGIGSVWGVQCAGQAAAGVCSEQPDLFGKVLVLQALPGTQGIYGFLLAVLIMVLSGKDGGCLNSHDRQRSGFFSQRDHDDGVG